MESIVLFFERLVSEFSWRRLGLLVAVLVTAILAVWLYEAFTGHFRAARMQFSAEQLARLSDPELKKNVDQDPELQRAHQKTKEDLNQFLAESQLDMRIPEPLMKAIAALAPWALMMVLMVFVVERPQLRGSIGGAAIVAIPCAIVGAILPTSTAPWLNYILYPILSFTLLLFSFWLISRFRQRRSPS